MKVKELIEILEKSDKEADVIVYDFEAGRIVDIESSMTIGDYITSEINGVVEYYMTDAKEYQYEPPERIMTDCEACLNEIHKETRNRNLNDVILKVVD